MSYEGEAERLMSRAVDVAGGTECKRRKEIVSNCAKSPLVHQVISKNKKDQTLGC